MAFVGAKVPAGEAMGRAGEAGIGLSLVTHDPLLRKDGLLYADRGKRLTSYIIIVATVCGNV